VFLTIGTVYHSSKTVKRQSKQQKSPLVYQSSHVYTESAEYTKPRKRRYLAKPPSQCAWAVATASRPWAGLTVCVYMDVHATDSRLLPRVATLSSTYCDACSSSSLSTTVIKFSIFSDPTRKLSALPPELRRIR